MKRFVQYYLQRTISEMDAAGVQQQLAGKVQQMADTMRQMYPQFASQLDALLQQYQGGQIDVQQLAAQAQKVSGMTRQLGTAFGGGPQAGTSPMIQPRKRPVLGAAFNQPQATEQPAEEPAVAPPAPQGGKPMLGAAFTGGQPTNGPMLKPIRRKQ